jgi:hypothetical protein
MLYRLPSNEGVEGRRQLEPSTPRALCGGRQMELLGQEVQATLGYNESKKLE